MALGTGACYTAVTDVMRAALEARRSEHLTDACYTAVLEAAEHWQALEQIDADHTMTLGQTDAEHATATATATAATAVSTARTAAAAADRTDQRGRRLQLRGATYPQARFCRQCSCREVAGRLSNGLAAIARQCSYGLSNQTDTKNPRLSCRPSL